MKSSFKKTILSIIIGLFALLFLLILLNKAPSTPTGLTVETIRDPRFAMIVSAKPKFSWVVPQKAVMQTGYQILVSSSKDLINNNNGDIWASGKVSSNQSVNVEFDGKPFQPNTTYFWKVRITGLKGKQTKYSDIQQFTTGNLDGTRLTTPNWFQIEKTVPVETKEPGDSLYFLDFGKAAFGTLELSYEVEKSGILNIHVGEKLLNGRIDRKPGGTIRYQKIAQKVEPGQKSFRLQLKPDARNTNAMAVALPDSFPVILPFRYVEIERDILPIPKAVTDSTAANHAEAVKPEPVGRFDIEKSEIKRAAWFNYFEDNTSAFHCSDTILNQVWEFCKYSQKATTFAGYYIDGDRERIPYEADAYLNQLSHYAVDNEYAIARRTIEYFMEKPTWPTEWQLHVALMVYQDYMYTGNTAIIEKYYDQLKHKTLSELEFDEGLISTHSPKLTGEFMHLLGFADTTLRIRDIVDWPQKGGFGGVIGEDDGFVFLPVNAVINALYYRNLVIMAEFAQLLGKTDESADYSLKAARVKKSYNQKLYNAEKGHYTDGIGTDHGSVHANMFPMTFGLVPDEYRKNVARYIKSRGMACSVYGAQYLMEAVYIAGDPDYALELMTATHDRSWYNMIRVGSTISMEAWDMKYKPNSDWNHAWGAVPANIVARYLWGMQPLKPGFEVVKINPQMSRLEHSSIKIPTIRGEINADYQRIDNKTIRYAIELPANMTGEFHINFDNNMTVTLNRKPVNLSGDAIRLNPGKNKIEIKKHSE